MKLRSKLTIILLSLTIGVAGLFTACAKGMKDAPASSRTPAQQTYTCPMHPQYTKKGQGECPVCGMNLVPQEEQAPAAAQGKHKVTRYRSTMMPNEVSDKPGKDSMGMDMVPFEVEETAPSGPAVEGLATVTIPAEKQQLIGVKSVEAVRKDISKVIRTSGRIAYDPDLYYAEQEYISAAKTLNQAGSGSEMAQESARSLLEASRQRLHLMGLSDAQIDELGTRSEPDRSLLVSRENGNTWVYAPIYEDDIPSVKAGQKARITIPSVSPAVFRGTIIALDPVLDPATRSIRARILTENRQGLLKPEVFTNVEIDVPLGNRLVVPADAVLNTGTRQVVFIDRGNGVLEPRQVRASQRTDGLYVIDSGLSAGDKVVTNANFLVDSESQLKATMQSSGGGHQH